MKKIVRLFCIGVLTALVLGGCGIDEVPDEKKLSEMLPEEIVNYKYEGELQECTVESFEIVRRQTEEKSDVADCRVVLEDEKIMRTVYITLQSNYYDKGGWQIDSWELYDEEETGMPKTAYEESNILEELQTRGYQTATKSYEEFESGYSTYVYEVEEKSEYLTINGEIVATSHLVKHYTMDERECITNYKWETRIDTNHSEMKWNVDGTWTGENYGFGRKGHFDLTIQLLDEGDVDASGLYYWPSTEGGEGTYKCTGASYEMKGDSMATATLIISVGYTNPGGSLTFTANEVKAEIEETEFVNVQRK